MDDAERETLQRRLEAFKLEHRDLDDIILRLTQDPMSDQLQLIRLKKRKLLMKDMIAKIASQIIPDLEA